jgi:hypothetical protein
MAEQSSSTVSSKTLAEHAKRDFEAQKNTQKEATHWPLVFDQTQVTPEVINWPYKGSGTEEDPYVVIYINNDRRNPMLIPKGKKWLITVLVAFVSFSLSEAAKFLLEQYPEESTLHLPQPVAINRWKPSLTNIKLGDISCGVRVISLRRLYRSNPLNIRSQR